MNFTRSEQEQLMKFLDTLNPEDVAYVILRNHQNLPHSVQGGDVDIFTLDNEFRTAISLATDLSITHNTLAGLYQVYDVGFSKPSFAIRRLVNNPRYSIAWVNNTLFGSPADTNESHEWIGRFDQLQVHLHSKLYYSSPWLGGKYQVDKKVQNSLISNRVFTGVYWIPSKPDHILHLLCRGLFDRRGDFPDYYIESCNKLYRNMNDDEKRRMDELFRLVFFDAGVEVKNALHNKNLDHLLSDLKIYADY